MAEREKWRLRATSAYTRQGTRVDTVNILEVISIYLIS